MSNYHRDRKKKLIKEIILFTVVVIFIAVTFLNMDSSIEEAKTKSERYSKPFEEMGREDEGALTKLKNNFKEKLKDMSVDDLDKAYNDLKNKFE